MPTRGSPALSSCASGCCASQSSSACTSRASASGESTVTVPPEFPNPRLSHVRTLKPALRSAPTPTLPVASSEAASGLVWREPPQPWPCEDRGCLRPARRGMEGEHDLRPVEGRDRGVAGVRGRRGDEQGGEGEGEGKAHGFAAGTPIDGVLAGVASERRGHAVLQRAGAGRARRGSSGTRRRSGGRRWCCSSRRGRRRRAACRSWRGSCPGRRCRACGCRRVPLRPITASDCVEGGRRPRSRPCR